jgi:hypothetical protein
LAAAALALTHQVRMVGMGQILCLQRLLLLEEVVAAGMVILKQIMEVLAVAVGAANRHTLLLELKEMGILRPRRLPVVMAPQRLLIKALMGVLVH